MNSPLTWSIEQDRIFAWFEKRPDSLVDPDGNLIVNAYAGTGKTTTIIEGVNRAPEPRILVAAFNKRIADEVSNRLTNSHAEAKTLHAVGYAAIRRAKPRITILHGTERAKWLAQTVCTEEKLEQKIVNGVLTTVKTTSNTVPDEIVRLIANLHTKAREISPFATSWHDLEDLAERFRLEPDEEWGDLYTTEFVCRKAYDAMELAARDFDRGIDFADMIFLPLRNHWLVKIWDLVVVDESQDMVMAQLEIAKRVCKGRIAIIGDRYQCIYAFRGADADNMDRVKRELHAGELGLTTTYRCGRAIVDTAHFRVPDFTAGPNNPDGLVRNIPDDKLLDEVDHGDFVLSRLNAPLVKIAMTLLLKGRRARIAGKDVGAGLKGLVRKLAKGRAERSVPIFIERLSDWRTREIERAQMIGEEGKREAKMELIYDQYEMISNLTDGAVSVADIASRIDALFTDDGLGSKGVITCSSVHRAKGLEADRVFVLRPTLRNWNDEENNIRYVAITRAKQELIWVGGPMPPKPLWMES